MEFNATSIVSVATFNEMTEKIDKISKQILLYFNFLLSEPFTGRVHLTCGPPCSEFNPQINKNKLLI